MLFICQANPYLRVYNPYTGDFALFSGGKLELEEGHPDFEVVKAEALRNPSIVMLTEATQCALCGEPFTGKAAGAQLGQHKKAAHFAEWVAAKQQEQEQVVQREVKSRQPHACDLCPRLAEFGSADDLAVHVKAAHIDVQVDDDGNVLGDGGSGDRQIGVTPAEPTAAKAK